MENFFEGSYERDQETEENNNNTNAVTSYQSKDLNFDY